MTCFALVLAFHGGLHGAAPPDFDRDVAPILSSRCLDCHSGSDAKAKLDLERAQGLTGGGKSGPAVVPGNAEKSLLWQRVRDDEMPPKHAMPEKEKEVLKAWIAAGAKWGTDPLDRFRATTASRAGLDWWSLRPLAVQKPPGKETHPIDAFVRSRLAEQKLGPSPAADRRTLIRRVTFDLLGLPPTPEEIDHFVRDASADAYERLVDRLLASPHYGERWARHWLDVAHFGESDGFEYDKMRPNAWHYRDWVIRALNDNMPFDRFARLQIAGDVLQPGDRDAVIATGFLVGGAFDGLQPAGAPLRKIMRQDELEDLVGLVGQSFLGLTLHCARCHDHKFDPVRHADYYRVASALSGVHRGDRTLPAIPIPENLKGRIERLKHRLSEIEDPALQAVRKQRAADGMTRPEPPKPLAAWEFAHGLKDGVGGMDGEPLQGAVISEGALQLKGTAHVVTRPLGRDLREKTLEAWVKLADLEQRGGGVLGIQSPDGAVFDAIVFGEREPGRWMAGSNFFARTQSFQGPAEAEAATRWTHLAISYAADGTITAYRDGKPYGRPYRTDKVVTFRQDEGRVVFGMRHSPAGPGKHLAGTILRARLYDKALSPDEVNHSFESNGDVVSEADLVGALSPASRDERVGVLRDLREEETRVRTFAGVAVYAVTPRPAEVVHVLKRGNPQTPGEPVAAGGIVALPGRDFGLPADAPEGERRRKLAEWITGGAGPLFARTTVNRFWTHHMGRGLVNTPNDLGFNGGRPSHPELLEWLAAEFVRTGYEVKRLHRLIVTSQTYRQASDERPDATAIDADNRLYWRFAPRRLDAESIRDAMLAVAGQLNPQMGGPGFLDVRPYFFRGSQFYEPIDPVGPDFNRRSIYRMAARGGRNPLLDTFDCPDPSTTTPKRGHTTTPLQALSLFNGSFTLRTADQLATRLERAHPGGIDDQITLGFCLTYGRPPEPAERDACRPIVDRHGMAPFCRALLNANGFLYVR